MDHPPSKGMYPDEGKQDNTQLSDVVVGATVHEEPWPQALNCLFPGQYRDEMEL